MRTYYHVADPSWQPGDDLLPYEALFAEGRAPAWKWGSSPFAAADTDVVCLFASMLEAESFADEFGGSIVEVALDVELDARLVIVAEGYPAMPGAIPARCLTFLNARRPRPAAA